MYKHVVDTLTGFVTGFVTFLKHDNPMQKVNHLLFTAP